MECTSFGENSVCPKGQERGQYIKLEKMLEKEKIREEQQYRLVQVISTHLSVEFSWLLV